MEYIFIGQHLLGDTCVLCCYYSEGSAGKTKLQRVPPLRPICPIPHMFNKFTCLQSLAIS